MQVLALSQNVIDLNHQGQLTVIPNILLAETYDLNTGKVANRLRAFNLNPLLTFNLFNGLELGAHIRFKYAFNSVNSDQWNYFKVDYGLVARKVFKVGLFNFINYHKKLKFKKRLYIYPFIEVRPYFGDHYILTDGIVKEYSSIQMSQLNNRVGVWMNWGSRVSLSLGLEHSLEDRFSVQYNGLFFGVNYQYGKYTPYIGINED